MSLFFSSPKAELVLALPVGANFQTWRAITHPAVHWADRQGYFPCWAMQKWPALMATGHLQDLKPRYTPGVTYHVGVPHWRLIVESSRPQARNGKQLLIFSGAAHLFRYEIEGDEAFQWSLDAEGDAQRFAEHHHARRMPGMFLPGWAATHWAKCLAAFPQKLGEVTEAQAKAELVKNICGGRWRDYADPSCRYSDGFFTARDSFLSMVDVIHRKPVPRETWGWRYEFAMAERPKEA